MGARRRKGSAVITTDTEERDSQQTADIRHLQDPDYSAAEECWKEKGYTEDPDILMEVIAMYSRELRQAKIALNAASQQQRGISVENASEFGCLNDKDSFAFFYWKLNDLQRERVDKYFPRAIERGYIRLTKTGCRWGALMERGRKTQLAWFIQMLLGGSACGDDSHIPYKEIEGLFGVRRLQQSVYDLYGRKNTDKWKTALEYDIFFD